MAPLLTQILTKVKSFPNPATIFDFPFMAIVAASLALRCDRLSSSLEGLRSAVTTQIESTGKILRQHARIYKNHTEMLTRIESVRTWASNCCDAISFGQMMCWLKVQHVLCMRLHIHDSSVLQLFGYMCERVRLSGEPLPTALDNLFNDRRINRLLFLDKRPCTLDECERGIKRWSDPAGMLENLKLTQHIFRARCKPTLTERIFEGQGRVTHDMTKELKDESLENRLDWELALPDLFRLEGTVITAVGIVNERQTADSVSTAEAWSQLRHKLLYQPEMQRKLIAEVMKQYNSETGW